MTLKVNDIVFVREKNTRFTPPMTVVAEHCNFYSKFFLQGIDDTYEVIDTEVDEFVEASAALTRVCASLIESDKLPPAVTSTVVRALVLSGLIDLNVLYPCEDCEEDERLDKK
jgi:hypothetical protein